MKKYGASREVYHSEDLNGVGCQCIAQSAKEITDKRHRLCCKKRQGGAPEKLIMNFRNDIGKLFLDWYWEATWIKRCHNSSIDGYLSNTRGKKKITGLYPICKNNVTMAKFRFLNKSSRLVFLIIISSNLTARVLQELRKDKTSCKHLEATRVHCRLEQYHAK